MAMIDSGTYEFNSLQNAMDFVKPLLVEGYSVAINTVYRSISFESQIDKFTVDIGKKGCKMAIYNPEKVSDAEGLLIKAKRYIKELSRAVESSYSALSWQRPPIKAEAEKFLEEVEE